MNTLAKSRNLVTQIPAEEGGVDIEKALKSSLDIDVNVCTAEHKISGEKRIEGLITVSVNGQDVTLGLQEAIEFSNSFSGGIHCGVNSAADALKKAGLTLETALDVVCKMTDE